MHRILKEARKRCIHAEIGEVPSWREAHGFGREPVVDAEGGVVLVVRREGPAQPAWQPEAETLAGLPGARQCSGC